MSWVKTTNILKGASEGKLLWGKNKITKKSEACVYMYVKGERKNTNSDTKGKEKYSLLK